MTALLRRWCPRTTAMLDARALRGRFGDRAVVEIRRALVADAASASLTDLRHRTSVWNELMRVPTAPRAVS